MNLADFKPSIEEEMAGFAMEMVEEIEEGWTSKKRFERFKQQLRRAADQRLGRVNCGKVRQKLKAWWD